MFGIISSFRGQPDDVDSQKGRPRESNSINLVDLDRRRMLGGGRMCMLGVW